MGKVGDLDVATVRERLRASYAGRAVILAGPGVPGGNHTIRHLRELGAGPLLVIATPAAAAAAADAGASVHPVPVQDEHSVLTQRRWEDLLVDPPTELAVAVERFDPDGQALLLVAPWCLSTELLGRRAFGSRRPKWEALEDKITVGSLWEAADVPAAPSVVVDVAQAPAAAEVLDRGLGTVWAGDDREGRHGGLYGVCWVPGHRDARAVAARMAAHHDRVR